MLEGGLKEHIKIVVKDRKEQLEVGNNIHFQLVGNQDYIDCGIILNIDTENEVNLYVYEGVERPALTI